MPRLKLSDLDARRKMFSDFVSYRAMTIGTTSAAIARNIGICVASMSKYKNNPGTMHVDDFLRLANALNMDAAKLLRVYAEGKTPWVQEANNATDH